MKKLVAMLSALTIAGCAIGPDYRRPAVVEPPSYRAETTAVEAESLADLPWWEVFQDEALRALIGESLSNNYDLRIAAQRVEEFRARAGIARSEFFPQIGGEFDAAGVREHPVVRQALHPDEIEASALAYPGLRDGIGKGALPPRVLEAQGEPAVVSHVHEDPWLAEGRCAAALQVDVNRGVLEAAARVGGDDDHIGDQRRIQVHQALRRQAVRPLDEIPGPGTPVWRQLPERADEQSGRKGARWRARNAVNDLHVHRHGLHVGDWLAGSDPRKRGASGGACSSQVGRPALPVSLQAGVAPVLPAAIGQPGFV